MKKRACFILAATLTFLAFPSSVVAHPGRTDSSGCHTCRTNCPDWGLSYGEYHCHGGRYTAPVQSLPTSTPKPKAIFTPTPLPTEIPQTPTSEVKSETTEVTPTPIVLGASSEGDTSGLTGLLGITSLGALGGGYWLIKRLRRKEQV